MIAASAYAWTPSDHFGMWQLVVAILGFGLAGWQLVRTANATERSTDLLERRLLSNDLLVMLPELHRLEDDITIAIKSGDRELVASALLAYYRRASMIMGYLKSDDLLKSEKLVRLMRAATSAASSAKGDLLDGTDEITDVVRIAREKIARVGPEAAELTARLQKGK